MPSAEVTQLIGKLKDGDSEAAEQIWQHYFDKLTHLARKRLEGVPKRVADEEDVALSVFKSLCMGAAKGRFTKLTDRDDLWRLLLVITKQKSVDQIRHQGREKRGGGEVRGESVFGSSSDNSDICLAQFVGEEPTPQFLTMLDEQHQRLLDVLRDDSLRQVALWKMEGFTNAEIADKLGITTRSAERKIKLIRDRWSKELDESR